MLSQELLRVVVENLCVAEQARQTRVLVVDDEPNIVDIASMALGHHGFEVESAGTGAGAVARVRERRPDVVVLDVMLSDMDGFEVAGTQRYRREPRDHTFSGSSLSASAGQWLAARRACSTSSGGSSGSFTIG